VTPIKWRHFRVTSGHLRSRDVISCNVTTSSCELQPCRKSNAHCTPVFVLQTLPGYFRWNDVTPGHFRSLEVTWHHFLSRDCLLLRATALKDVKRTVYANFRLSTATCRKLPIMTSLPGHFRSPEVTWPHFLSRDYFLLRAKHCRKSNAKYAPVKCKVWVLLQSLSGYFRWNDFTSESLPVTWGKVMSFPVTWLIPPASYSHVGSQTTTYRCTSSRPSSAASRWLSVKWRNLRVTSGHLKSRDVISCHVTASFCELQPCR